MNRSYWQSLSSLRVFMILLNFIIIVFYGSVFLLATKYVIDYQMTRDFLDKINHIPHHPLVVFFGSILLFIILLSIMYYRQEHDIIQHKMNMILSFVDLFWYYLFIVYGI